MDIGLLKDTNTGLKAALKGTKFFTIVSTEETSEKNLESLAQVFHLLVIVFPLLSPFSGSFLRGQRSAKRAQSAGVTPGSVAAAAPILFHGCVASRYESSPLAGFFALQPGTPRYSRHPISALRMLGTTSSKAKQASRRQNQKIS